MQTMRLAPKFKLWLVLGTTAGLIVTALLALMLAWGPGPAVETPRASEPLFDPATSGALPGALVVPWQDLAVKTAFPSREAGEKAKSNLPVLVLSSGVALVLSLGVLWAARQRREDEGVYQASPRLTTLAGVSHGATL
ncbi:MAG: hypothetical protein CMJ45_12730 [Planctomyces sp.]|nr:hypothetical protein [Planctomyces sp.]